MESVLLLMNTGIAHFVKKMSCSKHNSGAPTPAQSDEDVQGKESSFPRKCITIVNDGQQPCCSKSLPQQHHVRFSDDADSEDGSVKKEIIFFSRNSSSRRKSSVEQPPPLTPLPPAIHRSTSSHDESPVAPLPPSSCEEKDEDQVEEKGTKEEAGRIQSNFLNTQLVDSDAVLRCFSDTVLTLPNLHEFEVRGKEVLVGESQVTLRDSDHDIMMSRQAGMERSESMEERATVSRKLPMDSNKNLVQGREMDENHNDIDIFWPMESHEKLKCHASYLFHEDRRAELQRIAGLMPRGREYVIFNIFGDFARKLGFFKGRKKYHVTFPDEFTEKYEQQGDVAGKDRFVPSAKQPYKGVQTTSKKRRLSAVYSSWTVKSGLFMPHMERVENISKCGYCCEKFANSSCGCGGKGKKDTSSLMEGYWSDLNTASLFLHGHATQTFESAMSNLEFIRFHDNISVAGQTPWSPNYGKLRLGILSGSIWCFAYCIRSVITEVRGPNNPKTIPYLLSEASFRRTMEQYAALCLTITENVKTVLQYGHNFYNFAKECQRIMKVLQIRIGFKGEIKVRQPMRRGDGLEMNRTLTKREICRTKGMQVMIAKSPRRHSHEDEEEEEELPLEWKPFEELTGPEKGASLRQLIQTTSEGMSLVHMLIRFLVDDIVDLMKDTTEPDLLFVLADMYDRFKYLEGMGRANVKSEIDQIVKAMTEFCKDLQSFVNYGWHIIKRFVELRDMVHLSYEFLKSGLDIECLSEMVPGEVFKKEKSKGCFGFGNGESSQQKGLRKKINNHHPKYKPMDFFRVYFNDLVTCNGEIVTNRFNFKFETSKREIVAIIPVGKDQTWGDVEPVSPRLSFDNEYMDKIPDDEDDDDGAGDTEKQVQMDLKPILLGTHHDADEEDGGEGQNQPAEKE